VCAISSLTSTFAISSPDEFLFVVQSEVCRICSRMFMIHYLLLSYEYRHRQCLTQWFTVRLHVHCLRITATCRRQHVSSPSRPDLPCIDVVGFIYAHVHLNMHVGRSASTQKPVVHIYNVDGDRSVGTVAPRGQFAGGPQLCTAIGSHKETTRGNFIHSINRFTTSRPVGGQKDCDQRLCVSICLAARISKKTRVRISTIF